MALPNLLQTPEYYFQDEIQQQGWNWQLLVNDLSRLKELAEEKIRDLEQEEREIFEYLLGCFNFQPERAYNLDNNDKIILRGIISGYFDMNKLARKLITYLPDNHGHKDADVTNSLNNKFNNKLKIPIQLLLIIKGISLDYPGNLSKALIRCEFEKLGYRSRGGNNEDNNNNQNPSQNNVSVLFFPEGPLDANSPYYVERPGIEGNCYNQILDSSGGFIRIKGPRKMGKTSLLYRIINHVENRRCFIAFLDFGEPEKNIFDNLATVSEWFCASVSRELGRENRVSELFNNSLGINANTSNYFEEYLLRDLADEEFLLLAMDNVDNVFEHPNIADGLCRLWRSWHTHSKVPTERGRTWRKLKIVLAHATDVYADWDINRSPLQGIGFVPILSDWEQKQVQSFIEECRLGLEEEQIRELMAIIGGHPYLVGKASQYLYNRQCGLESLLDIALQEDSPFNTYLAELFSDLLRHPELCSAYQQVLSGCQENRLDRNYKFKLESMGLIRTEGDRLLSRYELYTEYFLRYYNQ